MKVTLTETEDSPVWGPIRLPEPDGVLRPAGEGHWVADFPDGSRRVVRVKGAPWGPAP
jgi:hypothetical protein